MCAVNWCCVNKTDLNRTKLFLIQLFLKHAVDSFAASVMVSFEALLSLAGRRPISFVTRKGDDWQGCHTDQEIVSSLCEKKSQKRLEPRVIV